MSVDTGPALEEVIDNPDRGASIELVLVAHRGETETLLAELQRMGIEIKREYPTDSVLVEIPEFQLADIQHLDGLASIYESDCFEAF